MTKIKAILRLISLNIMFMVHGLHYIFFDKIQIVGFSFQTEPLKSKQELEKELENIKLIEKMIEFEKAYKK